MGSKAVNTPSAKMKAQPGGKSHYAAHPPVETDSHANKVHIATGKGLPAVDTGVGTVNANYKK